MLNLFINRECNLGCDYCFVGRAPGDGPGRMGEAEFQKFSGWLAETGAPSLAILGGEPTLHPLLPDFLAELSRLGIGAVVFTNGLFAPDLAPALAAGCLNLVVNCNHPSAYRPGQLDLWERNLRRLRALGAKMTFSKNFPSLPLDYGHLLEAATRHGITCVRFDVARPAPGGGNRHLAALRPDPAGREGDQARPARGRSGPLGGLADFVRDCRRLGISAGLDCCLPLCYFTPDELACLEGGASRFSGTCRPSLDVLWDLSVIHCQPLAGVRAPDVTRFAGEWDLLGHFAEAVSGLRRDVRDACGPCPAPRSRCQGGCLAAARPGRMPAAGFPSPAEAVPARAEG